MLLPELSSLHDWVGMWPPEDRLTFKTAHYQASATANGTHTLPGAEDKVYKATAFFPQASVMFKAERGQHYHVPLTWSPFGYSTYRGS